MMGSKKNKKESNLFANIFGFIRKYLNIKSKRLSDYNEKLQMKETDIDTNGKYFSRNTVDSWATRGSPQTQSLLEALIEATKGIIRDDIKIFGSIYKRDELINGLFGILEKYQIDSISDLVNELVKDELEDSVIGILRFAYDNKGTKKKEDLAIVDANHYSRLVIFDLDGTLIKGIKYSWTLLYQAVGLDTSICNYNKKRFERKEISYSDWCKYDCDELRQAGLTREKAYAATDRNCSLTINFYQAIHILKDLGFAVAIISGGADPVLYSLIPQAKELFDGNILINKLNFTEDGRLDSITPTEYDWDDGLLGVKGKRAGLELFCKKYGIHFDEETNTYPDCVFVGDDDNDFKAMEVAGLRILYYVSSPDDKTYGIGGVSGMVRDLPSGVKLVERNDLLVVANLIKDHFKIA